MPQLGREEQVGTPISNVQWCADLLERYDFTKDLGRTEITSIAEPAP